MDPRGHPEPTLGQRVAAMVPGTEAHAEKKALQEGAAAYPAGAQGYGTTGIGGYGTTAGGHATTGGTGVGTAIKEHVPGTAEYGVTHGPTPGHIRAQDMKAAIPGTDEHRLNEHARTTGAGTGGIGTYAGSQGTTTAYGSGYEGNAHPHKGLGTTIKENVPGTAEYEVKHGSTAAHHRAQDIKAAIPGTQEHMLKEQAKHATHRV